MAFRCATEQVADWHEHAHSLVPAISVLPRWLPSHPMLDPPSQVLSHLPQRTGGDLPDGESQHGDDDATDDESGRRNVGNGSE